MKTKITVTGLGGGINFEMRVIEKALRENGCKVEVINDAADWTCSQGDYVGWRSERNLTEPDNSDEVVLIANHVPWGG